MRQETETIKFYFFHISSYLLETIRRRYCSTWPTFFRASSTTKITIFEIASSKHHKNNEASTSLLLMRTTTMTTMAKRGTAAEMENSNSRSSPWPADFDERYFRFQKNYKLDVITTQLMKTYLLNECFEFECMYL